jgi:hypothetical protein
VSSQGKVSRAKRHQGVLGGWDGITDGEIFFRDQWQCRMPRCLCPDGREISRRLPPSDPWSASVDHVTRLADGGPDTAENKRAAHRECNNRAAAAADRARARSARRAAVLGHITANPACTAGGIETATGLTPERIWAVLRRAERAGIIRRERAPSARGGRQASHPWLWSLTAPAPSPPPGDGASAPAGKEPPCTTAPPVILSR